MILRELPEDVARFLESQNAPMRLVRHLRIVHDTCWRLLGAIDTQFPPLSIDRNSITVGAAIHDVGKILHQTELFGSGRKHEQDGEQYLVEHGFPTEVARFARTHGSWSKDPNLTLEDLIVSLSDAIWKGSRIPDLEAMVATSIATKTGLEAWDAYSRLDSILTTIARDADERIDFQKTQTADTR